MNFSRFFALALALALASPAFAQSTANQTIQSIPTANTTFLPDLQNFLRFEDANRFAQQFQGFVVSGGTHGTGASLTQTPTALVAYPGGQYTTESGSITYANNKTQWVIADAAVSGNTGVNFTRVAGTHYLLDSTSGSKPALPANSVWLMEVTTSGGSVTVVTDLRTLVPFAPRLKLAELPAAGTPGRLAFVTDVSGGIYYWDNGVSWNSFAPPASTTPVLANWVQNGDFEVWFAGTSVAPTSWTLTGASAAVARDTTAGHVKVTNASAQVTSGAGAVAQLYQDVDLTVDVGPAARWGSKTVMLGAWVRATSASVARIGINDGVNATFYSSFHSGNSALSFLTVTATLTATPTRVRVILESALGINAAQFDGVVFGEGQVLTDFLPSSFDQAPAVTLVTIRSYLAGLGLSTAGSSPVMTAAAGQATSDDQTTTLALATNVGKTTSAWTAGTGNGGLDTGAIANSTWYHFYVIGGTGKTTDVLLSLSASAPTMPSGFTLKRRIGSGKTDGSGNWTAFTQNGDCSAWLASVRDVQSTNPGTSAVLSTLTVPPGVIVQAIMHVYLTDNSATSTALLISDPAINDQAPTTAALGTVAPAAPGATVGNAINTASEKPSVLFQRVVEYTNASAQVRTRLVASGANTQVGIYTIGWCDRRGRDN